MCSLTVANPGRGNGKVKNSFFTPTSPSKKLRFNHPAVSKLVAVVVVVVVVVVMVIIIIIIIIIIIKF